MTNKKMSKTYEIIDDVPAVAKHIGDILCRRNKLYVNKIIGESVVWEEISDVKSVPDSILDDFKPAEFTFFVICDPEQDREILEILNKLPEIKPNITKRVWTIGKNNQQENFVKFSWMIREKDRDETYRKYEKFPQIWHRGEFIGGLVEFKDMLRENFDWD